MARVVFVYPDFESLGVEYLMSACQVAGQSVDLVFYNAQDTYIGGVEATLDAEKIALEILKKGAEVAAFSCVTDIYRFQLRIAQALKRVAASIVTIFGGVHVTAVPQRVFAEPAVDAVAIGEGDRSFPAWLVKGSRPSGGFSLPPDPVQGITHKRGDQQIGDFSEGEFVGLEILPFPCKEPFLRYLPDAAYVYRIITSRGCPFACSYCYNSQLRKLRGKSMVIQRTVENVIAELVWAKKTIFPSYIWIGDDCLTLRLEWLLEFCRRYLQEVALPFSCVSSPSYLDRERIEALRLAGCNNIQFGVQSLSEELCKTVLQRHSENRRIAEVLDLVRGSGMLAKVDHMMGIPGDTLENQEKALRFYAEHPPGLIQLFWLTYYPGTAILSRALSEGILTSLDIEKIERGEPLTKQSYLAGGSMQQSGPFIAIGFVLNWLPLLPQKVIQFLVETKVYRLFRISKFFWGVGLPRALIALLNPADSLGLGHIQRILAKWIGASRARRLFRLFWTFSSDKARSFSHRGYKRSQIRSAVSSVIQPAAKTQNIRRGEKNNKLPGEEVIGTRI